MEIYTIGFTKKSAREFFELLKRHDIQRVLDIRLNNSSQLAGFTKRGDLEYFLAELCRASYVYEPLLAPSDQLLKAYRTNPDWGAYEIQFTSLLRDRQVENRLDKEAFRLRTALLCSEATAKLCHRRLVAEYLQNEWDDVQVIHL
jgi:uncharacterized protein (DUF488 family)